MTSPARPFRSRITAIIFLGSLLLGGCSTAPIQHGEPEEPIFSADRVLQPGVTYAGDIYDPWEGFNRTIYRFNYRFDKYVFLPAVRGYKAVLPGFAETGLHNFFTNFRQITTLINSALQLSGTKTFETTGRLVINSTVGILGFIDVATYMRIPQHQEDLGQTLGYWGVGTGPYLVLPVLGPSSVRDGIGLGVDTLVRNEIRSQLLDPETWQEWTWDILDAIDTRANVAFRYYETGSPFEYGLVRMLYTTKRQLDIEK